jgi:Domain of unknown function (DUF4349)
MTSNDTDQFDAMSKSQTSAARPNSTTRSIGSAVVGAVRSHTRVVRTLAILAVAGVVGAAYVVGGPPDAHATSAPADGRYTFSGVDLSGGGEKAATNPGTVLNGSDQSAYTGGPVAAATAAPAAPVSLGTGSDGSPLSSVDTSQIVKTGQMTLEVAGIDDAVGRAQAAISGLGGSVESSNRYGTGDEAVASVTFRIPVAKWDEALADMRKIGSKTLSEQTGTTDVTGQVIDLDARITNLQTTEAALQAIMARASAIPDVIAVETQLSDTQGAIESLTAQSKHLKDQAAMSTLTVSFQLPTKTVITEATQDWTLYGQIDQAGAALVRIGQGLATLAVWAVVVVLPVAVVLAVLLGFMVAVRRIRRRAGRGAVAAA